MKTLAQRTALPFCKSGRKTTRSFQSR